MTTPYHSEVQRLGALIEGSKGKLPSEILSQLMAAQAQVILNGVDPKRDEAGKSILHSALVVSYMHGTTAEHEWSALPTLAKLKLRLDGDSETAWRKRRTRELLVEGFKLAWPGQALPPELQLEGSERNSQSA
jgi:hypothetical protein